MVPDAVLIVDCPACVDPSHADRDGRQCDGLYEWIVDFRWVDDPMYPYYQMLVPVNERDMSCRECGERGRIYVY